MAQLKWLLGVVSAVALVAACGGSDSTTPVGQAGAPSAGAPAMGGSGGAVAAGGMSNAGAPVGGAPAAGCTPACTGEQACVENKCMPKPTLLTTVAGCGKMALAVSKGTVYFTDSAHGNIGSIPVAGGTPTMLATGQKAPYALAVDDAGVVYWSNSSTTAAADNTLMMQAPGGMATKIADVPQPMPAAATPSIVRGITLDGKGSFYFGAGGDLMKVEAKAAATPAKIGSFSGVPTAIVLAPTAAAPTRIFTTLAVANAVEWRLPDPTMTSCTDPITRPEPPENETAEQKAARTLTFGCSFSQSVGNLYFEALSLAGTNVLFIDDTSIQIADTTVAATMSATRTQVAATADFNQVSGFTNNATTVYFGEVSGGIIEKATLPKSDPVILVEDPAQVSPSSFVNDGTNIYWRTGSAAGDACSIMKLPM